MIDSVSEVQRGANGKMGRIISFGIQKGGVGKTTTASITSYLLAKKHKVLAVDFDSQGNMTYFLSQQNIYNFQEKTILEAMKEKNAKKYIYPINENLHLLPAEDVLITLNRYLYTEYRGRPHYLLKKTLEPVVDEYDYIIIDLPPNLGDQTTNGLSASDYTVIMLQSDPFCYDALDRYMHYLQGLVENRNPYLHLLGILTTMFSSQARLDQTILEQVRTEYADIVFKSVIKRRSRIKEFSSMGITDRTKADREVLRPYQSFVDEMIERIKEVERGDNNG